MRVFGLLVPFNLLFPEALPLVADPGDSKELKILTRAKLIEIKLSPVTETLFISYSFELFDLLLCICFNELFNDHVSSSHSNDKLTVDDLSKDFTCTKHVESFSKSSDRNRAVSKIKEVSKKFIY